MSDLLLDHINIRVIRLVLSVNLIAVYHVHDSSASVSRDLLSLSMLQSALVLGVPFVVSDCLQVELLFDILIDYRATVSEVVASSMPPLVILLLFLIIALHFLTTFLVLVCSWAADPTLSLPLALSSHNLHDFFLNQINILLAGPHSLDQGMVLLL